MTMLTLLSSGSLLAGADINTVVGVITVVLLLAILVSLRKGTQPAAQSAPVAAPVKDTASAPAKNLMDDNELVAVITASIHAYEASKGNTGAGNLVVRSITKRRW